MKIRFALSTLLLVAITFTVTARCYPAGHESPAAEVGTGETGQADEKVIFLPETTYSVEQGNRGFDDPNSEYSYARMYETPNAVIFWTKELGDDPTANEDPAKRLDIYDIMSETERFYDYFVNTLKFAIKGNSVTDRNKILIFVLPSSKGGTAFGGGDDGVGMFWSPPVRMNRKPYGAVAHELGHSFQFIVGFDGNVGFKGAAGIFEMTSQYMLWQVYPNWVDFEQYHMVDFLKQNHLAFLHTANQYHSPFVLEYWSERRGLDFVGTMWRESAEGEDPVMTYKRLTNTEQSRFNDEMFDASRRFITWDIGPRTESVTRRYANMHYCKLTPDTKSGWYRITGANAPQNYGYNGIKLDVPAAGKKVTVDFEGMAGAEGYAAVNTDKAGWRYGFVAYKADGTRVYGDMESDSKGKATFKVPEGTEYLWFVVMGAPAEHWKNPAPRRRGAEGDAEPDAQWPYRIKVRGTNIASSFIE